MGNVLQKRIEIVSIKDINFSKIINGSKKCTKCKQIKLLDRFSYNNRTIDKLCFWCKECVNNNHSNWYAKKIGKSRNEIRKNSKNEFSGKIINNQKLCGLCQQWKQIECFNIDRNAVNGLQSRCIECHNLLYKLLSRIRKIEFLIAYGGKCICCGETEIDLLTVEHIRDKGYELIYGLSTLSLLNKLKEQGWPKGYSVLCFNCNQSTKEGVPCPHTKEYRIYEEKLEMLLVKDKRLNEYNRLMNALNERRLSDGVHR